GPAQRPGRCRAHAACRRSVIVAAPVVAVTTVVATAAPVAGVAVVAVTVVVVVVVAVVIVTTVVPVVVIIVLGRPGAERHGDSGAGTRLRAGRRGGGDHVALRHV